MAKRQEMRIAELQETLGQKYKILKKIGSGGFGEVYLGEHAALGRKIAIKILLESFAAHDELVTRFQREAKAAATLQHPNIIDIYDVGESEDLYYFVMKYIEGETLAQKMEREKKVSQAEAIYIIKQVADALDYAHEHDVIHRDIKPANIMLDQFGKPILMDFGVARIAYEGNLTKTGTLMGTPHYLAPEQPLGKTVDRRSDIYSMGILMYEMLAGRPPFHDENSISLIFKHINETPTPLEKFASETDPKLSEVIHKMIAKLPEERYQTAAEVVDELEALAQIYPVKTTLSGRRTNPGATRDTERLLLLAQEHVQQDKLTKAIEIYKAIKERNPEHETAKREMENVINRLRERFDRHIRNLEFSPARALLGQMEQAISENDLKALQVRLTDAEAGSSSTQTIPVPAPPGFDPAAVDTEALKMVQEDNTMAGKLEEAFESKVNSLIEDLKIDEAVAFLESVRSQYPAMTDQKLATVREAKEMHEKLSHAKTLMDHEKLEEADTVFEDVLQAPPVFDYKILYKLRKEAENLQGQTRKMLFNQYMDEADLLVQKKDFEKAKQVLQRILEKDKNYAPAVKKWKEIEEADGSSEAKAPGPEPPKTEVTKTEPAKTEVSEPTLIESRAPQSATSQLKGEEGQKKSLVVPVILILLVAFAIAGYLKLRPAGEETSNPKAIPHSTATKQPDHAQPLPPTSGKLTVSSEPEGATVLVDGQDKGVTPVELTDLPFGSYNIKLQLKGYKDSDQQVELSESTLAVELPILLDPVVKNLGSIRIDSIPSEAEIYIGKHKMGVTPKVIPNMGPGNYKIVLKKEGYQDFTGSVKLKESETAMLAAQLMEVPAPQPVEPEITPGMLVELTSDVEPPQPIKKVSPRYTDAIKQKKLTGTVQLSVLVSETGAVIDAKVTKSVHPLMDDLALKAIREWVYQPARKKGIPVKVWIPVSFTFVQK